MLNNYLDQIVRNARPVLLVVSCLCLSLGSCYPSSEPLNRIVSAPSVGMANPGDTHTSEEKINYVFSSNPDSNIRNLNTILKSTLLSSGQIPSINSSLNNSQETENSIPSTNRARHRSSTLKKSKLNPVEEGSHSEENSRNRSSKKRRLSSMDRRKARKGLQSRAGRRNRRVQHRDNSCGRIFRLYSNIRQLENQLSFNLAVYPDGVVNGTTQKNDIHTLFSLVAVRNGYIRIFAVKTERFVCMNNRTGNIYSAARPSLECVFLESRTPNMMMSYSLLHSPLQKIRWYIGITKHARVKNGRRVRSHHKIARFLAFPIRNFDC
ncbi:Fibroblast growth factor 13 [Holothuria leucospilota]|uniref:Fibroblast growth factor 13 n=2 Tax=Holothuria leucospilota TaxID=206669 RepID=A0A9Q1BJP3_HOLLE|nr:Fibroblast growth factor 13 [Holothuria leucospilota]